MAERSRLFALSIYSTFRLHSVGNSDILIRIREASQPTETQHENAIGETDMQPASKPGLEHGLPGMVPGLDGRPAPVVGKRTRHAKRNSVRARVDHGKVAGAGSIAQPALTYSAQLADAETDVAEMELNGTVAQHREALDRLYALQAKRDGATVRIAPVSLQDAIASRAVAHVRNGTYERALATSEARRKKAEVLDWASYCFAKKSKVTLQEWRALK